MTTQPQHPLDRVQASPHGLRTAQALMEQQRVLCETLTGLDGQVFGSDSWRKPEGGGGVSRVLEEGRVFEKGGVLFSAINGSGLPPVVLKEHPDLPPTTPFFATGVSLILHPVNPFVPTVHFNVRYFEVGPVYWYGGGMDLTPYYPFQEDCVHFHRTIKASCDRFDTGYYPRFKPWCDSYFYLKHRQEPRGIGGIFFNYLKDGQEPGLNFILELCATFLRAYAPLVERRRELPFTQAQRDFQAYRRGRYVEFNLIYDQGTLFGLQAGGRVESILASLPPQVRWRYDYQPAPESPEAALTRDFLPPRDWVAL